MIRNKLTLATLLAITCTATALHAAGNGSSPNGKPFIAIQGQLTEVNAQVATIKEQMNTLIGRVESLEDRVSANEGAIASLEEKNILIDQQIADLIAQTGENSVQITNALMQIMGIRRQIAELEARVGDNSADIASLRQQSAELEAYVEQNASGILALEAEMSNNAALILALQDDMAAIKLELEKKQDILAGNCPTGSSLRAIAPDGSIACEYDDAASGIQKISVTHYVTVPGITRTQHSYSCGFLGLSTCYYYSETSYTRSVTSSCPSGTVSTGGNASGYGISILSEGVTATGYYATGRNDTYTNRNLYSTTTCLSLMR